MKLCKCCHQELPEKTIETLVQSGYRDGEPEYKLSIGLPSFHNNWWITRSELKRIALLIKKKVK